MKKVGSLFLCLALLQSMMVWAGPIEFCQKPGDVIADSECEEVYYVCDDDLIPVKFVCAIGLIFVDVLKMCCVNDPGEDGYYWVCKSPKSMPYGCYRGNLISFRPTCSGPGDRCSK